MKAARKRNKVIRIKHIEPNVNVDEFLEGETLRYTSAIDGLVTEATYRTGVGIFLERDGADLGTANVIDDVGAKRAYYTLTSGYREDDEEAA